MTIIEDDIQNIVNSNIPWDQIQGKSFLISGAAGFLATYMAHTIMYLNKTRSTNSTLFALVRNKKEAEQWVDEIGNVRKIEDIKNSLIMAWEKFELKHDVLHHGRKK